MCYKKLQCAIKNFSQPKGCSFTYLSLSRHTDHNDLIISTHMFLQHMIGYLLWFLAAATYYTVMHHTVCSPEHVSVAPMAHYTTQASLPDCESVGSLLDPLPLRPVARLDPMTLHARSQATLPPSAALLPPLGLWYHAVPRYEVSLFLVPSLANKWNRWRYKEKQHKKKKKISEKWLGARVPESNDAPLSLLIPPTVKRPLQKKHPPDWGAGAALAPFLPLPMSTMPFRTFLALNNNNSTLLHHSCRDI